MSDPTIEKDEKEQIDDTFKIAPKYIGEPMIAFEHTRVANDENIIDGEKLEGQQEPTIAPLTHRFGKAQVEQEAIIGHIMLGMTGRIGGKRHHWRIQANRILMGIRSWTTNKNIQQHIHACRSQDGQ